MAILKAVGLFIGSFVLLLVGMFFLYPYINQEKYHEMVLPPEARADILSGLGIEAEPHEEFDALVREVRRLQSVEAELTRKLNGEDTTVISDSLMLDANGDNDLSVSDSLFTEDGSAGEQLPEPISSARTPQTTNTGLAPVMNASDNQMQRDPAARQETRQISLTERIGLSEEEQRVIRQQVNSLLNLDEEELGPIVRELSNTELIRLYSVASNQQREKLLRSLPPTRAARIMKEAMQ